MSNPRTSANIVPISTVHWAHAINRAHKTDITFCRITYANLEELQTLWRFKDAEPGKVCIRYGKGNQKVIASETFRKYYRLPITK